MKQLTHKSYRIGEILLEIIKLQYFWLLFTLKGGILLGIFPSSAVVIQYFIKKFDAQELPASIGSWYKQEFHQYFKQANQLGWMMTLVFTILKIDLAISREWIQSKLVHFFLIALLIFFLGVSIYLFPSFVRYRLSFSQYFKQAFFLFLCSIPETIAIFLGLFLLTLMNVLLPILTILALAPLFLLPISWFSYRSMKKIESQQNYES